MKVHLHTHDEVHTNVQTSGEFTIANTTHAFKILSSSLYSNKIKAIVRELSCNAVDSHVAAGKPKHPFTIHLPNTLEPYFSIRDEGTGLSEEEITGIYTTYFGSSKRDSNELIGALGLGSKSPFSYTDHFSVTSRKDGKQLIYTAFLNDKGLPAISKMAEHDTDECNGIEVSFAVKELSDIRDFSYEAKNVLRWFEVKPIITGDTSCVPDTVSYNEELKLPGAKLYNGYMSEYSHGNNRVFALQGSILYPVNLPSSDQYSHLKHLLQSNLILTFDIGEIDIAPSREALSYDNTTVNNIVRRLEDINKFLIVCINDQVNSATTAWDKVKELLKLHKIPMFQSLTLEYVKSGKLPLLTISQHGRITLTDKLWVDTNYYKTIGLDVTALKVSYRHSMLTETDPMYTSKDDKRELYELPLNIENLAIVVNDTNVLPVSRVKYHYSNSQDSQLCVFVLSPCKGYEAEREKLYKLFQSNLKNPPCTVLKVSELRKRTKSPSSILPSHVLKLSCYVSGIQNTYSWHSTGVPKEFTDSDMYYYVPLSNRTVLFDNGNTNSYFSSLIDYLKFAGLRHVIPESVYGVRKSKIKDLKDKPNWKSLYEHTRNAIMAILSDRDAMTNSIYSAYKSKDALSVRSSFDEIECPETKEFYRKLNVLENYKGRQYSLTYMKQLATMCNIELPKYIAEMELLVEKEVSLIETKYPLLRYIDDSVMIKNDGRAAIIQYINLIGNTGVKNDKR